MVDKEYCMSSYLAFRYIEDPDKDFCEGKHHKQFDPLPIDERKSVRSASDISYELEKYFQKLSNQKLGIMLSGGMDSAILASFMPKADAYTFRFLGGRYQKEELQRAKQYADTYDLTLHYVDIDWDVVVGNIDAVMVEKAAPVHSIEPQIYEAARHAIQDGIELMVVGESSDLIFGGMDQLLSKDWSFDEFVKRYTFTDPTEILKAPVNMRYLFERYRLGSDGIDFLRFMDEVFARESSASYENAFKAAGLAYCDPYARLVMAEPLDLSRIRNGESKYLIRNLFKKCYSKIPVPEKIPMPRPVDEYFKDWDGPKRPEFRDDIDINQYTGNQKWQMWCLEHFLDMLD